MAIDGHFLGAGDDRLAGSFRFPYLGTYNRRFPTSFGPFSMDHWPAGEGGNWGAHASAIAVSLE